MSVEILPTLHSRPASLYQPDVAGSSASCLNHSSYSPFPSFGVKHDPHGLDKFLLPPDDPSWLYTQPAPAEAAPTTTDSNQPQPRTVKKIRSFSSLRRPSPLSQPPVNHTGTLGRRRSNSESASPVDEKIPIPIAEVSETPKVSKRQSIRRALSFRKKSVFGMTHAEQNGSKATLATLSSTSLVSVTADVDATPRLGQRSNSTYSETSTSSTVSSEEVITPTTEGSQEELSAAKLAAALESESGPTRRKSILGWFGGRRKSPSPEENEPLSNPDEPMLSSRVLPGLTPDGVEDDLVQSAINSAERFINRGYLIEQLRRMSYAKLNALNQTSTHPWARTLGRQDSNLFDEIAPTLHPDVRSFPFSVNVPDESSALYSMQRREFAKICVRQVIAKLDSGMVPEAPLSNARRPLSTPKRRLPYPSDFLTRPPYEERNLVFFPNGTFSPISMARPGYGVWDIDHSRYITVLCSIDQNPATRKPERRSSAFSAVEPSLGDTSLVSDSSSTPDSEPDEVLVSPAPVNTPLEDVAIEPVVEEPVSSFRRVVAPLWDSSSEEDEDEDEEEEGETLASALRRSQTVPALNSTSGIKPALKARSEKAKFEAKRVSIMDVESSRREFAEELAKTRERRSANDRGEGERRAEIEKRRAQDHSRRSASSVPPTVPKDRRGRTLSAQDLTTLSVPRPLATRQHSLPASLTHKRRSLYDTPALPFAHHAQHAHHAQPTYSHPAFSTPSHHHPSYTHGYAQPPQNQDRSNQTLYPPTRPTLPPRSRFSLGAPVTSTQHTRRPQHIA